MQGKIYGLVIWHNRIILRKQSLIESNSFLDGSILLTGLFLQVHMNYVVIDLEMCKVPKLYRRNYKHANETIQIGAVLLDSEFKKIATLRIF